MVLEKIFSGRFIAGSEGNFAGDALQAVPMKTGGIVSDGGWEIAGQNQASEHSFEECLRGGIMFSAADTQKQEYLVEGRDTKGDITQELLSQESKDFDLEVRQLESSPGGVETVPMAGLLAIPQTYTDDLLLPPQELLSPAAPSISIMQVPLDVTSHVYRNPFDLVGDVQFDHVAYESLAATSMPQENAGMISQADWLQDDFTIKSSFQGRDANLGLSKNETQALKSIEALTDFEKFDENGQDNRNYNLMSDATKDSFHLSTNSDGVFETIPIGVPSAAQVSVDTRAPLASLTVPTMTSTEMGQSPIAQVENHFIQNAIRSDKGLPERLHIALTPETLGRIEIAFDFASDGRLAVIVQTDNAATFDLMRRDTDSLLATLRDAGFTTDAGDLSFNLRQQQPSHDYFARSENISLDAPSADFDFLEDRTVAVKQSPKTTDQLDIFV